MDGQHQVVFRQRRGNSPPRVIRCRLGVQQRRDGTPQLLVRCSFSVVNGIVRSRSTSPVRFNWSNTKVLDEDERPPLPPPSPPSDGTDSAREPPPPPVSDDEEESDSGPSPPPPLEARSPTPPAVEWMAARKTQSLPPALADDEDEVLYEEQLIQEYVVSKIEDARDDRRAMSTGFAHALRQQVSTSQQRVAAGVAADVEALAPPPAPIARQTQAQVPASPKPSREEPVAGQSGAAMSRTTSVASIGTRPSLSASAAATPKLNKSSSSASIRPR